MSEPVDTTEAEGVIGQTTSELIRTLRDNFGYVNLVVLMRDLPGAITEALADAGYAIVKVDEVPPWMEEHSVECVTEVVDATIASRESTLYSLVTQRTDR